jgi:DNA-binding CsgD family transcriptional regulator
MAELSLDNASVATGERPHPLDELTRAERNVLRVLTTGARNREIATRLCLSEATVRTHLTHIYAKFGVDGRTALIAALRDSGLDAPPPPVSDPRRHLSRAVVATGLLALLFVAIVVLVLASQPHSFPYPVTPQLPRVFGGGPEAIPTFGVPLR